MSSVLRIRCGVYWQEFYTCVVTCGSTETSVLQSIGWTYIRGCMHEFCARMSCRITCRSFGVHAGVLYYIYLLYTELYIFSVLIDMCGAVFIHIKSRLSGLERTGLASHTLLSHSPVIHPSFSPFR